MRAQTCASVAVVVLGLLVPAVPSAQAVDNRELNIRVLYQPRACSQDRSQDDEGLVGARLEYRQEGRLLDVRRPGSRAGMRYATLDSDGEAFATLEGVDRDQPVSVTLVFETDHIDLRPMGKHDTYRLNLGRFDMGRRLQRYRLDGAGPNGAATLLSTMREGYDFAEDATVSKLPSRIIGRWEYDPLLRNRMLEAPGTSWEKSERTVYVAGDAKRFTAAANSARHEWERWPVLHEMGHMLLDYNESPGPADNNFEHDIYRSYPDRPAGVWAEGFANGFAALANQNATLTLKCTKKSTFTSSGSDMKLSSKGRHRQLAGHNEMHIGSIVFNLAKRYDSRIKRSVKWSVGLKRLLQSMNTYDVSTGHTVQSIRDFRDALALNNQTQRLARFTETPVPEEQAAIDNIFENDNARWGFYVAIDPEKPSYTWDDNGNLMSDNPAGIFSKWSMYVTVEGPGLSTCYSTGRWDIDPSTDDTQGDGGYFSGFVSNGPLSWMWQDDCFGDTTNLFVDEVPARHRAVRMYLPMREGGSHEDDTYTITLHSSCETGDRDDDPDNNGSETVWITCRSARNANIFLGRTFNCAGPSCVNDDGTTYRRLSTSISRDASITVATIKARGACTFMAVDNCSR